MSDKGEVVIIMSVIKMLVTCKQCYKDVCNVFCNNGVNDM